MSIEVASRKVRVSPEPMAAWERFRTVDGYLVTMDWGKPDPEGWYNPAFTRHDDDRRCDEPPAVAFPGGAA